MQGRNVTLAPLAGFLDMLDRSGGCVVILYSFPR